MTYPKYSIIIPARNGANYLPTCVNTIITQDFTNYELIISDDHSNDDTSTYLNNINHPNIKIVHPPIGLSMAEHWGWALDQTCGKWLIFVGQDDGLQPYFFKLAEILTQEAEKKKLRTIMSERAYFFWPGCDGLYGDTAVSFLATNKVLVLNSRFQALRSLLGLQTYFELPEMYTTSLFSREIIEEAKLKQNGKLFTAHPQDANLAAIACSLDRHYLKSMIPLGWVGSSPKSAGLAIVSTAGSKNNPDAEADLKAVRSDYLSKTANSSIKYHSLAGNFSLGSTSIYFWNALLQTEMLRSFWINKIIKLSVFKTIIFSAVLPEIQSSTNLNVDLRMEYFFDLIKINNINFTTIKMFNKVLLPIIKLLDSYYIWFLDFSLRVKRRLGFINIKTISYSADWNEQPNINMIIASQKTKDLEFDNNLIESIIKK